MSSKAITGKVALFYNQFLFYVNLDVKSLLEGCHTEESSVRVFLVLMHRKIVNERDI